MGSKFPNKWMVFLLALGMTMAGLDRGNLSVAAPVMMKELNVNPGHMGLVLSAFFWSYMVFNIPAGILLDRFGPKKVYGAAAILWSIATTLTGAVNSVFSLVLCRFGLGLSESVLLPTASKINSENFSSEQRGTVTGMYMAGLRVGMAVTPVLITWIISLYDWPAGFYISGIFSFLGAVLWIFTFPKNIVSSTNITSKKPKFDWMKTKQLLSKRNTIAIVSMKFFVDVMGYMVITWLLGYLYMERGFSLSKMGIYSSLPWIASMISMPLAGIVSDYLIKSGKSRTFARKVPLITCQLLATAIVFTPWVPSAIAAVWLVVFVMFCHGTVSALQWTVPSDLAPKGDAGTLGGIVNTASSVAGGIAPIMTGYVIQLTGTFTTAFVVAGGCLLMAALFTAFVLGDIKPMDLNAEKKCESCIN